MVLQLIVSVSLIVAVVLQRSKGEGLGSIGGGSRLFHYQPKGWEAVLDKVTTGLAIGFMVLSVLLSLAV